MEIQIIFALLILIALMMSGVYLLGFRHKNRKLKSISKQEPRFDFSQEAFPAYKNDYKQLDSLNEVEVLPSSATNFSLMDDPLLQPIPSKVNSQQQKSVVKKNTKVSSEEIIYFILACSPDKPYMGYELLQSLLGVGLRFGAMDIFHRYEDEKILFSVASACEPGTFEITKMGGYTTKGLMMFLTLNGEKDFILAFEKMLEAAKQLVEDLKGDILDEERKVLSEEKIIALRTKVVKFEQRYLIGDLFDQEEELSLL